MTEEQPTPKRRKRLSAHDRWTIFQEAAAKDAKGPGRKPKDKEKEQLRQELAQDRGGLQGGLDRKHAAPKNIGLGLIGAIRGYRLDPEVKLELVGAVVDAKREGFAISRSCELLMLCRRRFHRWVEGKDLDSLRPEDLADEPPIPKTVANQITESERAAIIDAGGDPDNSHLRHRKLAHALSRREICFVSPSPP